MVGMKAKLSSEQSENTRISQVRAAQNGNESSEGQRERAQSPRSQSQSDRDQSQDERAQSHDKRAHSQNKRAQSRSDRARVEDQRAQSQNGRDTGPNDCGKSEDCRVQIQRDIQDSLKTNVVHNSSSIRKEISLQNSSSKTHKKLQSVNNAKEQRFLDTIIIIACIAVVTVLVGTVFIQLNETIVKERPKMSRILKSVCFTIYCFNFAVNPFVYCLRLKQYQKTFQMVYGCK